MNLCRLADRQVLSRSLCRILALIVGDDVRSLGNCTPTWRFLQGSRISRRVLVAACQGCGASPTFETPTIHGPNACLKKKESFP
jgi:hypothetical protein